ncbi:MAG TPA: spore maturation protein [Bacillota bacterium]|nr:spore maturation protein [Bacillota bacterium]
MLGIPLFAAFKKVKVYETFCEGASEGFQTAIGIIPYLLAMLVAIGIFRDSGAMDVIVRIFRPVTSWVGMPSEVLPLAFMKSLSGGGSNGLLVDALKHYGPDSLIGRIASTMNGSSETTFYVIAVYFGAVGIRKTRHAVAAGLVADLAGVLAAVWVCRLMF